MNHRSRRDTTVGPAATPPGSRVAVRTTHSQVGLFALGTSAHAYLELDLTRSDDAALLLAGVTRIATEHESTTGANLVIGLRPELWAAHCPGALPTGTADFTAPVVGPDGFTMPATQHDLLVWVAASAPDRVFDTTSPIYDALGGLVTLADETHGWPYGEHRDLTGFIDGTENPTAIEAPEVVIVPGNEPGAGGAVLLLQKWEHDYGAWTALSDTEQEGVIGRAKGDGTELEDRPTTSHAARTDQDVYGRIYRRNTAYGTLQHHGTMFVGISATQRSLHAMLRSMAGLDGDRDALTRYATPLTGAYYFVPSLEDLANATRAAP